MGAQKACTILALVSLWYMSTAACPAWTSQTEIGGQCKCGNNLNGVIQCNNSSLSVLYCYCITQSKSNLTTAGKCTQMCRQQDHTCSLFNTLNKTELTELNDEVCGNKDS